MITFGSAQILGSLNWRELSAKLTEGVPARRRQSVQYIIAVRNSRHHPSASLPPSSERRANRCPKFAQTKGSLPEGEETFGFFKEFFEFFELSPQVTEGVSHPQSTESTIYYCCANIKTPPVSFAATLLGEEGKP